MLRSRHWFGYGSLLAIMLALTCLWWSDHRNSTTRAAQATAEIERLDTELRNNRATIEHLATQSAIAEDQIEHLVGELRKSGASIERMASGGFRRTYGQVPPNYLVGPPAEILISAQQSPPVVHAPAGDPRAVYLEVVVAEIATNKLGRMGIDLEAVLAKVAQHDADTDAAAGYVKFIEALVQNNLAKQLSGPRIATVSGRKAVFDIGGDGGGTKLELSPHILDSGEIRVEASIDLVEKVAGKDPAHFALTAATDLQPGRPHCLAQVATRHPDKKGDVQDYCTVVILTADTRPPEEVQVGTTPPRVEEANAASTVTPQRR